MDITTLEKTSLKNPQALPKELLAAFIKHQKAEARVIAREGFGSTLGGRELAQRSMATLAASIRVALAGGLRADADETKMLRLVSKLDPDVLALVILQTALHSLGKQEHQMQSAIEIGTALSNECWAAGLIESDAKRAKSIAKRVKLRHASSAVRMMAAKREASTSYTLKNGTQINPFEQREWPKVSRVKAGQWALNVLTEALPETFRWREELTPKAGKGGQLLAVKYLEITDEASETIDAVVDQAVRRKPVWFCETQAPKPWDAFSGCGPNDPRVNTVTTFLRTRYKATAAAARAAVRSGQMQPAMDGVNTLQAVEWTLNVDMYDLIIECYQRGLSVPGLPPRDAIPPQPRSSDAEWEAMTPAERKLKRLRKDELKLLADAAKCDRVMFIEDMKQARELAVHAKFWTPMNCDWRGRIYSLSHFNFQREDRVRALFLFANGEPIGVEGLRWLKIHVANCGAFNKVDKRPMDERVQWCDDNMLLIEDMVKRPLLNTEWTKADKPFLFIAACRELISARTLGPSYVCSLPVSFDGSCSGLQHLSAMTRAKEGSLVNLTPSEEPQDVYATVAKLVNERLQAALLTEPENTLDDEEVQRAARQRELARLALDFGIGRSETKRAVMTYAYSSKKFGMSCQIQTDLMKPLAREVLEGARAVHPFAPWDQGTEERPSAAARFLADHTFEAIETIVHKPAEAMKFLQKLAKALAHEGKPLRWTSPVGIPWINRYHDPVTKRVELWLHDGGVRVRSQITVAVDDKPEVNKEKSANGVAPNFVHALDAAHLLLVANAARARGITSIATVHDSFGCLPSRATAFNVVIRETFAEMYKQHDVLAEILAQAKCDLTDDNSDRLPDAIVPGPLNLKEILNADFAFA